MAAPIEVRVNQVGYPSHGSKVAFAMLPAKAAGVTFSVSCGSCGRFFPELGARYVGTWNAHYKAIYQLNFSRITRPGRYRIKVTAGKASSGRRGSGSARRAAEYGRLVVTRSVTSPPSATARNVVHSVLNREPANLTDRRAPSTRAPKYDSNDNLLGTFHKIGGPVNVAGGWFDAGGGYEKFAYTASYAEGLMLIAGADYPGRYPRSAGGQFGLNWLQKLWNPAKKVLYIQVGIGNGNASNTIQGDYNFWFLPQAEDRMNVQEGRQPGSDRLLREVPPGVRGRAAGPADKP